MLKQSLSRNMRQAGRRNKVKHVAQLCLMLAVSLWMLYQLKHCYFNKALFNEGTELVRIGSSQQDKGKLGRKVLPGLVEEEEEEDGGDEGGRGDEFEQQVDDELMDETD